MHLYRILSYQPDYTDHTHISLTTYLQTLTMSVSSSSSTSRLPSKRLSISKSSVKSRSLLSLSSAKSNMTLKPIMERRPTYRDHSFNAKEKHVVKFVYSEAVERGFRRKYGSPDFGPFSAFQREDPFIEVVGLPQIYDDFVLVKSSSEHNKRYIAKLREELGDRYDELEKVDYKPTKAPKMSLKNAIVLAKMKQRNRAGSIAKLPPLVPDPPSEKPDPTTETIQSKPPSGDASRCSSRGPSDRSHSRQSDYVSRRSSLMSTDLITELAVSPELSRAGTYVDSVLSSAHNRSRVTSPDV